MAEIKAVKGGFNITHTTKEIWGVEDDSIPTCDMVKGCTQPITHIGSKGYIYCAEHAISRRQSGYERTRKLYAWELRLIARGEQVPSYSYSGRPKLPAVQS